MGLLFAVVLFPGANALAATTYTVTTLADTAGTCSGASCTTLRAAITAANASAGNTINFIGLRGTIILTSALPAITQSMTITGPSATSLTLSGNSQYQIFTISSGTVAFSDLTFIGGAIHNSGTLTVSNSTFSGNDRGGDGGALYNSGTLTVSNSTFFGNFANQNGGAIDNNGTLLVTNSTFSENQAENGGAISNYGTLTANNNIFAFNFGSLGGAIVNDGGITKASYNLYYQNFDEYGTESNCSGCTTNTNVVNGNPNLLPLGSYGGPTKTMLPQPGGRAICSGSSADVPSGVTTDQRGLPLTSASCSNGGIDLGSVQAGYLQVTTTADSGVGSLREAIIAANGAHDSGAIDFAASVTGTITLASDLPTISRNLVIIGPGPRHLTISGNGAYQIFNISSVATTIVGLTLANGTAANGGAIENISALTVIGSTLSGNSALDSGGAISSSGTLALIDSTLSGNAATGNGGAVSSTGALTVTNSTFFGNTAASNGGAIFDTGGSTLTNGTFSGNTAAGNGGAIYASGSVTVQANNNILTGNSSQHGSGAGIFNDGSMFSTVSNLYYQNLDAGITEDDCKNCYEYLNNVTGTNPLLAALGSYGGPTETMLPQPGSPAICGGYIDILQNYVTTDQRGYGRITTYNSTPCVDLGAVQTNYTAVAFASSGYTGTGNREVSPAPVVTVTENGQNIGGVPITLAYSGTGSLTGLGPVTTVGGTGATFSNIEATGSALGTLTAVLPITASGNAVQPAALSASATLSISANAQTITFAAPSSLTYGTAPITLKATGGASGNPVTFSIDAASTPGAAKLTGATNSILTITGAGTLVIDANQAAGVGYAAAAQVQQSILVDQASLTITASSQTVAYGSAVPTITPIFGTFVNGDTSAVLTRQPSCITAYTTTSAVGSSPSTSCSGAEAANYAFTYIDGSVTVTGPSTRLQFIPVTPCRVADTRNPEGPFGAPALAAGATREFDIPQSACNIPATAVAYSLNVTVVPDGVLDYLTLWPSGQPQPVASTLNSLDGRVKANAAITPAGTNGGVTVFAYNATNVILDIDGYFVPAGTPSSLAFIPITPCRVADTRKPADSFDLGGPFVAAGTSRIFPVLSGQCAISSDAQAYSLNVTAVPHTVLDYLTIWPTGQAQPTVSTLNATTGTVTANAAIVPAASNGDISVYVSNDTDVILDVNGYFVKSTGGLSLYTIAPCRVLDTRKAAAVFDEELTVAVEGSVCAPPATAQAYVLNATAVPPGVLNYLTLWPDGLTQPIVSTLNAVDGAVTSNMAIVPTFNGKIDAFSSNPTQLILDLSSYFAP